MHHAVHRHVLPLHSCRFTVHHVVHHRTWLAQVCKVTYIRLPDGDHRVRVLRRLTRTRQTEHWDTSGCVGECVVKCLVNLIVIVGKMYLRKLTKDDETRTWDPRAVLVLYSLKPYAYMFSTEIHAPGFHTAVRRYCSAARNLLTVRPPPALRALSHPVWPTSTPARPGTRIPHDTRHARRI